MDQLEEAKDYWSKFAGVPSERDGFLELALASRRIQLAPGETLVTQGDKSQSVYLLVEGTLKTVRYSKNGHEIWLASFSEGDLIGEMSGLTGSARSSTVIAVTSVMTLAVDYPDFENAFQSAPSFGLKVSKLLAERVRNTSVQLEELATLQTSARLHSELFRLGEPDATDEERATIANPPSVSELAVRIHAARESTSRAVSYLHKRGFLKKREDGGLDVISPQNIDVLD